MNWSLLLLTTAAAINCMVDVAAGAPERHWQTGTCTDAGSGKTRILPPCWLPAA